MGVGPIPAIRMLLERTRLTIEEIDISMDPDLEARSAGQKLMLRLGSDNQAVVERKLHELRALLITRTAASPRTNQ